MTNIEMHFSQRGGNEVILSHQFRTEIGAEHDEVFRIVEIKGDFELCVIENQYGVKHESNPNNLSACKEFEYINKYLAAVEECLADVDIDKDIFGEWDSGDVDTEFNAEEVVGYYFFFYADDAQTQWLENIKHIEHTEQDKEVTRLFEKFYR